MTDERENGRDAESLDRMEDAQRMAHYGDVRWLDDHGFTRAARELAEFRDVPVGRVRL